MSDQGKDMMKDTVAIGQVTADFKLSEFLPYRIVSLGQAMGLAFSKEYDEDFGLAVPEWRTLAIIGQYECVTATKVVAETPMDKVAVSRASARLVEKGLVQRSQREDDRRSVLMSLTPHGREVFEEIARRVMDTERNMLSKLTEEERATLGTLLAKVSKAVGAVVPHSEEE